MPRSPVARVVSFALLGLAVLCPVGCAARPEILTSPVRVETSDAPEIFPESWRKPPIAAAGKSLSPEARRRAARIMGAALAKYPPAILSQNLRAVYVLSDLAYSGIHASGTNSRTCVYVCVGDPAKGFTDRQVESTFHAEFSSILLREHAAKFDANAWNEANPPGFKYLGDGVDAVKQRKAGLAPSAELNQQGFLNQYAQSTLENDLNGVAARLFLGDPELWAAADAAPRLARKVALAIDFYSKLDPALNRSFFDSLRVAKPRAVPRDAPKGS